MVVASRSWYSKACECHNSCLNQEQEGSKKKKKKREKETGIQSDFLSLEGAARDIS